MRRALPLLAALLVTSAAQAQFTWRPPGELEAPGGTSTRPGAGRVDDLVYAPGMRFPIESAPAYANSQIYGHGGYRGPGGGQCDAENFGYPWHDNYCEERSWEMPMCPSGNGHQGQDIRAASCRDDHHWAVSTVDGTVTHIGSYSVYVTADDGRRYDFLHMRSVQVRVGDRVSRGQRVGKVSNNFGGTPTTVHLHFNIRMNVSGYGNVYAPTYMSLVRSYEELVGPPPFSAAYEDQTFPLASRPFELYPRQEVDGYIELLNTGAETWEPGATFLGTTEPRDGPSPLAAASWIADHRAATVDRTVPPGDTGRFAFTIRAPDAPGEYPQFFNLVQEGVAWFSDSGLPPDDQLQVKVTVVPAPDDDGDGHDASVDCDDADPLVHPDALDACDDGVDQDCDGADAVCASADAGTTPEDGGPAAVDGGPETRILEGGCSAAGSPARAGAFPLLVALAALLALLRGRRRGGAAALALLASVTIACATDPASTARDAGAAGDAEARSDAAEPGPDAADPGPSDAGAPDGGCVTAEPPTPAAWVPADTGGPDGEGVLACISRVRSSGAPIVDDRVPADQGYDITTFGGGSDAQDTACGPYADGTWYYAANAHRFPCGRKVRLVNEARTRCVVVEVADVGPHICVEEAGGKPIWDVSPLAADHLFGSGSIGWSEHVPVAGASVASDSPLGPCDGDLTDPARFLRGWIGGACASVADCDAVPDAECLAGWPGGHCTTSCTDRCDDRAGPNAYTACVEIEAGRRACVARCDFTLFADTGCREGYGCVPRAHPESGAVRDVCLPLSCEAP